MQTYLILILQSDGIKTGNLKFKKKTTFGKDRPVLPSLKSCLAPPIGHSLTRKHSSGNRSEAAKRIRENNDMETELNVTQETSGHSEIEDDEQQ